MAEGYEENLALLGGALQQSFAEIRQGYQALPLPILLPGADLDRLGLLQTSLLAGAERAKDLPVHVTALDALGTASHHWIAASVAYETFRDTQDEVASASAAWSLTQALGLMDLALALLRQG